MKLYFQIWKPGQISPPVSMEKQEAVFESLHSHAAQFGVTIEERAILGALNIWGRRSAQVSPKQKSFLVCRQPFPWDYFVFARHTISRKQHFLASVLRIFHR